MTSFTSGFIIWNQGSIGNPDFVPKEIFPPALQVAELTETVYATAAEATAAINANGGPHNYGGGVGAAGLKTGTGPAIKAVGNTAGAVTSTSDFLSRLTSRNTWLRVLKVVIGGILVIVGLAQLSHAGKIVKDVGEAAALA
jgi:hypothetical protein